MSTKKQVKPKPQSEKESLQERIKALEIAAAKEIVDQMFVIMDGIEGAIYVADMETYELLHVNSYIRKHFGNDLAGKKCYKVLYDQQDRPCAFHVTGRMVPLISRCCGGIIKAGQEMPEQVGVIHVIHQKTKVMSQESLVNGQ